jgi:ankyrin repeat protein
MWAVAQKHSDVVAVLLARGADVHARTEEWSQMVAVPPHGYTGHNRIMRQGRDTALMFAARVGDLASARLLVDAGAKVNDADAEGVSALALASHSGFSELVEFLLERGADPNLAPAGFTALHAAVMRRDEKMARALLAKGADANARVRVWTPTRRSSEDFHFEPALVGATPFWIAARFAEPRIMKLLVQHGADPLFVHDVTYVTGALGNSYASRREKTSPLMAAVGLGRGTPWVPADPSAREAMTLEAAKLCVELGVDVNMANIDGRTALDGAKALGFDAVIQLLENRGAIAGTPRKDPRPLE